ncbi:MAG: hypothetical protein H5U08_05225 [Thermogutta sp.]|uniref:hypothetical protein n=1 Tax=Thermogutta sp. TaxID=1962930 RepID=UPI0019B53B49|nr:hypothetical protein [Thermogutta sp.]MBC7351741.1 hypothetical protein [Thermogutta sp.]
MAEDHRRLRQLVATATDRTPAAERLAELHERIASAERRLALVQKQLEQASGRLIDEEAVARALERFDPVWESLSRYEQARLLRLLIERIDYDGRKGAIWITFHASGIKTLADGNFPGDAP